MGAKCCYRIPINENDVKLNDLDNSLNITTIINPIVYEVSYSIFQNDLKTLQDLYNTHSFDIDLNLDSDPSKRSPAHMAADLGQLQILEWLISNGAQINKRDSKGWNLLMSAVSSQNFEVIDFLLRKNCDVTMISKDGKSAYTLAKETGNENIIALMEQYI